MKRRLIVIKKAASDNVVAPVTPVITISVQPSDQSTSDGNASFSVTASVTEGATISYQWERSTDGGSTFSELSGQTSSSLSLSSLTVSSDQYKYRVVVSATGGAQSVNSNSATLSVVSMISIASQPSNSTVLLGDSATFSVSATITLSDTLSYQWEESTDGGSNWSSISGATSSSYTFTPTISEQGAEYRCVVGGSLADSVLSVPASLTIQAFYQASVGFSNGYALKGNYAWGWGTGQGIGGGANRSSPISISTTKQFNLIANNSGSAGAIALDSDSFAWSWGANAVGQLGNNSTATTVSSPVSVVGGRQWKQIAGQQSQGALPLSTGLDLDGYAFCWGRSTNGSIGNNQSGTVSASSPVSVVGGRQFSFIANGSGVGGVTALDENGFAWSWGSATGDGTTQVRSSPVSVAGGRQFTTVSRAVAMGVALDSDGYAYSWGTNISTGALGFNSTVTGATAPTSVVGGRQWRSIKASVGSSSAYFTVALDLNSYAFAWGSNSLGQLGTNSTANASSPVSVVGGRQFDEIYAGHASVIARSGSNYYVWGANQNGVLANGSTAAISSPTLVTNLPYAP
jgi:alpha-tubulin suppressor-like RCC1 family protein